MTTAIESPGAAASALRSALRSSLQTFVPETYGTIGSGDDTTVIQAALTAAGSAGGGRVLLGPGTWIVSSALSIPDNVILSGWLRGVTVLQVKASSNITPIRNSNYNTSPGNTGIGITDLTIDGNKTNQNGDATKRGIDIIWSQNTTIDSVEVKNVDGTGIYFDNQGNALGPHFHNRIYTHDNSLHGYQISASCRRCILTNLITETNLGSGAFLDVSELTVNGIIARRNGNSSTIVYTPGVFIRNVSGCNFANISACFNYRHGIQIQGFVNSTGANWEAQSNSQSTSAGFDDVHWEANSITVGSGGYGESTHCYVAGILTGDATGASPGFAVSSFTRYCMYFGDESNGNITLTGVSFGTSLTSEVRWPTAKGALTINGSMAHSVYPSGRYFSTYRGNTGTATAVSLLDTKIFLYPFVIDRTINVAALSIRVATAGTTGSAVKAAIWNDGANGMPTGVPISGLGNNTSTATTSAATVDMTVSGKLLPGRYWAGAAFTTAAPTCLGIGATIIELDYIAGRAALGTSSLAGLTANYTYANDITTLDLTSATFSDVSAPQGNPVIYLKAA